MTLDNNSSHDPWQGEQDFNTLVDDTLGHDNGENLRNLPRIWQTLSIVVSSSISLSSILLASNSELVPKQSPTD